MGVIERGNGAGAWLRREVRQGPRRVSAAREAGAISEPTHTTLSSPLTRALRNRRPGGCGGGSSCSWRRARSARRARLCRARARRNWWPCTRCAGACSNRRSPGRPALQLDALVAVLIVRSAGSGICGRSCTLLAPCALLERRACHLLVHGGLHELSARGLRGSAPAPTLSCSANTAATHRISSVLHLASTVAPRLSSANSDALRAMSSSASASWSAEWRWSRC